jgi:hypothetical protein
MDVDQAVFCPRTPLCFDARAAQAAYSREGANCGPGAIAAICGTTIEETLRVLGPEFAKRRGTTEVMLASALSALGMSWRQISPALPSYGLARIQWDGPWMYDPSPYARLYHSHWIGTDTSWSAPMVFDINAIGVGGWIPLSEWDVHLRPWLLANEEPEATEGWHVSDAYEVILWVSRS